MCRVDIINGDQKTWMRDIGFTVDDDDVADIPNLSKEDYARWLNGLITVIKFFLANGFDFSRNNAMNGSSCLSRFVSIPEHLSSCRSRFTLFS